MAVFLLYILRKVFDEMNENIKTKRINNVFQYFYSSSLQYCRQYYVRTSHPQTFISKMSSFIRYPVWC